MTRQSISRIKGFSLVEVVLAIGIVSFSVLATVGLLSVGNDTNKRARDEGFAAQIAANEFQRIRSLGANVFPTIPGSLPARYFDGDMKEVPTAAGAAYEVRNPPQAANPTIVRFTTLVTKPDA
jgi:uncharacterized protein (TIGR02598 family)